MKNFNKWMIRIMFIIPFLLFSLGLSAQDTMSYENAKKEIEQEFGMFPTMFQVYPQHALAGAWENFKQLNSSTSMIPPKYRELIQLAVASQIPCDYCVYFHSASAKAFGASEEEIQEAIADGAQTRQWSMVLQGNQVDLDKFKSEFEAMMKYMSEKPKQ